MVTMGDSSHGREEERGSPEQAGPILENLDSCWSVHS